MTATKRPGRPRNPPERQVSKHTVLLTPLARERLLRYAPTVSAAVNRILTTIFDRK